MTLRPVRYTLSGMGGYEERIDGDLGSLLREIPYLLINRLLPPRRVVNAILAQGFAEAGMSGGCDWEPFEIDEAEWEALRAALAADPDEPVEYVESPAWVKTPSDWHVWVMEYGFGVPAEEHRRLARAYEEIDARVRAARRSGDDAKVLELYAEHAAAGDALAEFLKRTLRPRRRAGGGGGSRRRTGRRRPRDS
jgi:hypothetical protein